jgi:hypothetical protein
MSLFSRLFPKDIDEPAEEPTDDTEGTVLVSAEDVAETAEIPAIDVATADTTDPILLAPVMADLRPPLPPPVPASRQGHAAHDRAPTGRHTPEGRPPTGAGRLPRPPASRTQEVEIVVDDDPLDETPVPSAPRRPTPRTADDVAADLAALHATFEDLAIDHVRPVRTLMVELAWGDAPASWVALARPALRSLRSMAAQVELPALCEALDGFAVTLDEATRSGLPVLGGAVRQALLVAYAPLAETLPRAFSLDMEGNRREPAIVQNLLRQVPTLDPTMLERLCAVGLGRLDALLAAKAEDLVAVANLPPQTAQAVVDTVEQFRQARGGGMPQEDPAEQAARTASPSRDLAALVPLVTALETQHRAYEQAAQGWSDESLAAKRRLRRERTGTWLQITVTLARLGALDWIERLEPMPFSRKVEELVRYLRQVKAPGSSAAPPAAGSAAPVAP